MFFNLDKSNLPIVKVIFNETNITDDDFQLFLNEWLLLYYQKENFIFYFDTRNMKNPDIKYSIKMSQFIKKLKKHEIQYLQKSIILINNNMIKYLLEFIFLIQSPVAPVYIYNTSNGIKDDINENIEFIMNHENTILINI